MCWNGSCLYSNIDARFLCVACTLLYVFVFLCGMIDYVSLRCGCISLDECFFGTRVDIFLPFSSMQAM